MRNTATLCSILTMALVIGTTNGGCGSSKSGGQTGAGGAAPGGGTQGNGGALGTGGVIASGGVAAGGSGGAATGGAGSGGTGPGDVGVGGGGAGGGSGGAVDAGPPSDGGAARDAMADLRDGSADAPTSVCPMAVTQGAAKSSSTCSVSPFTFDAAAVCGDVAGCPITTAYSLHCSDSSGYGPWLVPSGTTGASVLLATGGFTSHLFTIGAGGAARVDDVPGLTKAIESLVVERDGTRTIFTGEMPGLWRARETAAGWLTDEATLVAAGDQALVSEGRSIDETHAFAAYFNLADYLPQLATRDGSCWQTTRLGTTAAVSMAMDVDAMDRPWVAWLGSASGLPALTLVGPDGSSYTPWTGKAGNDFSFWDRPIVLAGGLGGSGAFPALGVQQVDGLHVLTPDADTAVWTDRVVPGSQRVAYAGDCPPSSPVTTGPACQGLTTCTQHGVGAPSGFGLVRTAGGRAYAGWLEIDSTTTYALTQSPPVCGSGVTPCMCQSSPTSVTRTLTLAVARVTNAATPDQAIRRFPIDSGAVVNGSVPTFFSLVMAARGDSFLAVAKLSMSPETQLLYLELDSSRLP